MLLRSLRAIQGRRVNTCRRDKMSNNSSKTIKEKLMKDKDSVLISYVTDIEGNLNYWNNFLRISKVVKVTEPTEPGDLRDLSLIPSSMFIYGGDVCDRSYGDLRVISDLLYLKEKYPDRVVLILGNRDINKLRLTTELLVPEDYKVGFSSTPLPAKNTTLEPIKQVSASTPEFSVYWVQSGFPNASVAGTVQCVDGMPPPSPSLREHRVNKLRWVSELIIALVIYLLAMNNGGSGDDVVYFIYLFVYLFI